MHVETPEGAGTEPSRRAPTIADWLAIPEEKRAELIGGRIVYQGMPGPLHGRAQVKTASRIEDPYDRRPGEAGKPGGFWLSMEVDMHIGGIGCRPDLLGWRRDRFPRFPKPDERGLVTDVPDWICEVLSPGTVSTDWGKKRRAYHQAGVPYYWLLDPDNRTLVVLRRVEEDYLVALVAGDHEEVQAPPFEAVKLVVSDLVGQEGEARESEAGAEGQGEPTP